MVDTPLDPRLTRKLMAELDEHFDERNGRYKNARSDERIAKDTGIALSLVISTREAAFGPLAEDPVLTILRADVEKAMGLLADIDGRLSKYATSKKMGA